MKKFISNKKNKQNQFDQQPQQNYTPIKTHTPQISIDTQIKQQEPFIESQASSRNLVDNNQDKGVELNQNDILNLSTQNEQQTEKQMFNQSSDKLSSYQQQYQQQQLQSGDFRSNTYVIKPSDAGEHSDIGDLSDESNQNIIQYQDNQKEEQKQQQQQQPDIKQNAQTLNKLQSIDILQQPRFQEQQISNRSQSSKQGTKLIDFTQNDDEIEIINEEHQQPQSQQIQQIQQIQDSSISPLSTTQNKSKNFSFDLHLQNLEEIYEKREKNNYDNLAKRQLQAKNKSFLMKQKKIDNTMAENGEDTQELLEIQKQIDMVKSGIKYDQEHIQKIRQIQASQKALKNVNIGEKSKKLNDIQVRTFTKIKTFTSKLKRQVQVKEANSLSEFSIESISDLAFSTLQNSYKYINNNKRKQSNNPQISNKINQGGRKIWDILRGRELDERCVEFLSRFPLIMPSSKLKIIWDVLVIITLIITLWMYPLDLIMGKEDMRHLYGWRWVLFNLYTFLVYVIDISSKFTTAYYEKAVCITDRKLILRNYLKGWFLYDLVSTLPFLFELFAIKTYFKFWNLLVFMKMPTFTRTVNNINDMIITRKNLMNLLGLLRLIFIVTFVAHIFGILWLGQQELLYKNGVVKTTWLYSQEIENEKWYVQYVWTMYFAITTMTTVGYGDITPSNEYEAGILIFGMVVATGMFAFTFNSIGYIVDDLTRDSKEFKKQASLVNIFLNKKNTPPILKLQIHKYLEYKFQSEKSLSNEEEQMVISKLPENMQEEIKYQQALFILNTNSKIFGKFSPKIIDRIAKIIKERKYHKHENIFQQDQISQDPCFYFIQSGKVELYTHAYKGDKQFTILQKLGAEQSFGEFSFLTGQQRHTGAQTTKPCMLSYIKRSEFLEILQKSIPDYEVYCMNRDKIQQQTSFLSSLNQCFVCKQHGHLSSGCPYIHLVPNIEKLAMKKKFVEWQKRDLYHVRSERLCYNSLLDQNFIKERGEDYFLHMSSQSPIKFQRNSSNKLSQISGMGMDSSNQQDSQSKINSFRKIKTTLFNNQDEDGLMKNKLQQAQQNYDLSNYAQNQLRNKRGSIQQKRASQFGVSAKNNYILESLINDKIHEMMNPITSPPQQSQQQFFAAGSFNSGGFMNGLLQNAQQLDVVPENPIVQQQHVVTQSKELQKQQQRLNENLNKNKGKKGITKFARMAAQGYQNQKRDSKNIIMNQNKNVNDQYQYLSDLLNLDNKSNNNKRVIFQDVQIKEEQPPKLDHDSDDSLQNHQSKQNKKVFALKNFLQANHANQKFIETIAEKKLKKQPTQDSQSQTSSDSEEEIDSTEKLINKPKERRRSLNKLNGMLKSKISNINTIMKIRNYSKNMNKKLEENLKKKEEELHEIKYIREKQIVNDVLVSIPEDTQIKNFDKYYPRDNYNPDYMVKKLDWTEQFIVKTPEFGIYTIQERRIQRKNYQVFDYNFDKKIHVTVNNDTQHSQNINSFRNKINLLKNNKSPGQKNFEKEKTQKDNRTTTL